MLTIVLVIVGLGILGVILFYTGQLDRFEFFRFFSNSKYYRNYELAWQAEHDKNAPKKGDPAIDFELTDSTGEKTIRLSSFKDQQPVALIFGSYT